MYHSHASIPSRPDGKIAPESVASRTISPSRNRLLKHLAAKRRRRHDRWPIEELKVA